MPSKPFGRRVGDTRELPPFRGALLVDRRLLGGGTRSSARESRAEPLETDLPDMATIIGCDQFHFVVDYCHVTRKLLGWEIHTA